MSQFDETQTIVMSLSSTQGDMTTNTNDLSQDDEIIEDISEENIQDTHDDCDDSVESTGDFTQRTLARNDLKSA